MSGTYRSKSGTKVYSSQRNYSGSGKNSGNPRRPSIGVLVGTLVVVIAICVGAVFLFRPTGQVSAHPKPGSKQDLLTKGTFHVGVFVDDIALGDLTKEEAKRQIEDKQKAAAEDIAVTVLDLDGTQKRFALSDLPEGAYAFNTDDVLEEAYKIGREGADNERYEFIKQLPENPVKLTTAVASADPSSLEQAVRNLTLPYFLAPVNAAYDPSIPYDKTKTGIDRLTFKPSVDGHQVNPDALWESVKAQFADLTFGTVPMITEIVPPSVTVDDVKANMQLLHIESIPAYTSASSAEKKRINEANMDHTFTTRIKNSAKERRNNIKLANGTVSGLLLPGEIFDFNLRTGIRDEKAGYQEAPVDIGGKEDLGLGGGICQVSSTLYNAVIRYGGKYESDGGKSLATKDQPGLAVIERDSHSVPSGYVMKGSDATVDMQLPSGKSNKNLRFRNDFDKPILIVLYSEKIGSYWFEHCDIYGPPLPEGYTYDLVGRFEKSLPRDPEAPMDVIWSKNATPGNYEIKSGHDGFSIEMWIEKKLNGERVDRYKIYTDVCLPQQPYWYLYPGEAVPTPTIEPTPTPTETPPLDPTPTPTVESPPPES